MERNNTNFSEIKKYVVEAPIPQRGQVISSGGIRENGKIAVQFKNPVPYEEPKPHINNNYYIQRNFKEEIKRDMVYFALDLGSDIAFSFWSDCLKPVCKELLFNLCEKYIVEKKKDYKPARSINLKATEIIEQEKEKSRRDKDENIIYFPQKKIV